MTTTHLGAPALVSPAPAPWVRRVAHAVPLLTLPSALWRLALVVGLPVTNAKFGSIGLGEMVYIVSLSLVTEGLALLTLGLVQPWGEVCPRWLPLIGGRRVHPLAATVPALLGALALTLLWTWALSGLMSGSEELFSYLGPTQAVVIVACYLPLLAWGPLLAVVTVDYYRRRTRAGR